MHLQKKNAFHKSVSSASFLSNNDSFINGRKMRVVLQEEEEMWNNENPLRNQMIFCISGKTK